MSFSPAHALCLSSRFECATVMPCSAGQRLGSLHGYCLERHRCVRRTAFVMLLLLLRCVCQSFRKATRVPGHAVSPSTRLHMGPPREGGQARMSGKVCAGPLQTWGAAACREEKRMHVMGLHMSCLKVSLRRGACVSPTPLNIASCAYPCGPRRIAFTHVAAGERLGAQMCTTR